MKKYLLIATLLTLASTANANWWTKSSEQKYASGDGVCQWKSGWGTNTVYTTTVGMGYCPRPR